MKRRSLTFRETKNGHDRTVPMTPALSEALQALPPPDRRRQSRPAGLQRPSRPHARVHPPRPPCGRPRRHVPRSPPRRGPATLTMAGVPQRAIMELLGHRDPRMTVRYQHLAPGHLRDAMGALERAAEPPAPATVVAAQ